MISKFALINLRIFTTIEMLLQVAEWILSSGKMYKMFLQVSHQTIFVLDLEKYNIYLYPLDHLITVCNLKMPHRVD